MLPKKGRDGMKKKGILNREISRVLATMGHYDLLVIADAGLPIPTDADCIDLVIDKDIPTVLQILKLLSSELEIEEFYVAEEGNSINAAQYSDIERIFPNASKNLIPHNSLKEKVRGAKAVIRTGDFSPYSNVILSSGVSFSTYSTIISEA
jgi:D-ribose pyranase